MLVLFRILPTVFLPRYNKELIHIKLKIVTFINNENHQNTISVFNFPAKNSPNLGVNHHLEVSRTGAMYIPAGNSPILGVSHHPEVIGTEDTYMPARNSPNLEVMGTGATFIPEGLTHSNLSSPHLLVPFLHLGLVRL